MTVSKPKLIGVVGPCGSGKSSLTQALDSLGYTTRHIAQEHSYVKDMWKRMTGPDILIYLHVSYAVSQVRRPMNWSEANYQEQLRRLQHAREHADLVVDTDQLEIGQLVERVESFIKE